MLNWISDPPEQQRASNYLSKKSVLCNSASDSADAYLYIAAYSLAGGTGGAPLALLSGSSPKQAKVSCRTILWYFLNAF
jgi:hypothetical protein